MANLEPVFTIVFSAAGGVLLNNVLKYFNFFRNNKVENRKTESERLEAENARANKRADDAEQAEAERLAELVSTRRQLFDSEEYVSRLRAQLLHNNIDPYKKRSDG